MTMLQLSLVCFWSLLGLALYNTFWTVVMAAALRRRRPPMPADDELPRAAVLLCLRGADPNLPSSLRRLFSQDYPNYDIFIAVDSKQDPAWQIVHDTVRQYGASNVHVSALRERLPTCSLKCSSLVQLLDEVDESHAVIVLADADLESHRTWLRELVAPMSDPRVGATFGNRWFLPTDGWMGSLVRQLCNAPSIVVMFAAQIPWGGSLAIRSSVVREGKLREKWSHAIVDDGPVRATVKQQKLKLKFVPSLLMANREECDLPFAFDFLRRQLTWTSTYVRSWWPALLTYSLVLVSIWVSSIVLAVYCWSQGAVAEAGLFGSGAATLGIVVPLLWLVLDASARSVIRRQGEPVPSSTRLHRFPLAAFLAASFHLLASLSATFARRIAWRGVTYEILGPWDIRVLDEGAYQPATNASGASL